MVTWTPVLSVGVAELDEHNRELFLRSDAYLAELVGGSQAGTARFLEFLIEYALHHFTAEEAWMKGAAYPGLAAHREEHRRFVVGLMAFRQTAESADELSAWLIRWLWEHVMRSDGAAARAISLAEEEKARA